MKLGKLKDRIRIERPDSAEGFDAAGSGAWAEVGRAWAEVQDMVPSRGERMAEGLNVATRPARVRMRYRPDITSAMRIVVMLGDRDVRVAQIITQPAILGRRDGLEFIVEDYSTAGNAA